MPLSVLEAMAAGLPVASTDVGDVRAMVAAQNDAFIGALTDGALAGSLRALLMNPDLRREIGAANRAKAEVEFNQDIMFEAYGHLFAGDTASV